MFTAEKNDENKMNNKNKGLALIFQYVYYF